MKAFFDAVRAAYGSLSQDQVDGFNRLIAASNDMPLRHQAYLLATAWWESARTMQPIHERGTKDYFKKYDAGTSIGKARCCGLNFENVLMSLVLVDEFN